MSCLSKLTLTTGIMSVMVCSAVHAEKITDITEMPEVVVTDASENSLSHALVSPASVLKGDDLRRQRAANLGDT